MMNIFAIPKTDASIDYLRRIFGNVGGTLCIDGDCGAGASVTILSTMFKTFNSIILVIAVLLLIYVTLVALIGTAHEGEFMGKKMNNIWIPIRAVLGIALLVPTGAGYCGIQILMMWVIVQGIGAADSVWSTALNYINVMGSPYVQANAPIVNGNMTFTGLFKGLACTISTGGTIPAFSSDPDQPSANPYDLGNCGSLTFCDVKEACGASGSPASNSIKCAACTAQLSVLPTIISVLSGVAQEFVNADNSYRDFAKNSWNATDTSKWRWINNYCNSVGIQPDQCCITGDPSTGTCKAKPYDPSSSDTKLYDVNNGNSKQGASPGAVKRIYWPFWVEPKVGQGVDFIKTSVGYYQDAANGALSSYVQSQANQSAQSNNPTVNKFKDRGWIFAGGLYYTLANSNSKNMLDTKTALDWKDGNLAVGSRNNITAAGFLAAAATGDMSIADAGPGGASGVQNVQTDTKNAIQSSFEANLQNDGATNPLYQLQIFGSLLLLIVQILFLLVLVLIVLVGVGSSISFFVLGTGVTNPTSNWMLILSMFLIPLFWMVMGLLVSMGAALAIYTPLLPFIYFTYGALAWIVSTVEALVAGPLVALGIISPSGQHEIMGKAEPALLLLFNIFLRPTLMIFGLIVAMLLAVVAVTLINNTFWIVVDSYPIKDPLTMIFLVVAYVTTILGVLNKCFAVINLIPQQVIRWIGGQGEAVEAPTEELKGRIEGAAGKAGGIMGEGAESRGQQAGGAHAKRVKAKEKAKKAAGDKDEGGKGVGGK